MRIYIFLLVALAAAATPALGGQIPVFVVAGQSNAVGAGTGYTALSSNLKVVQPNVLYSGPQESAVSWASLSPPTQTAQMVWPWDPKGGFGPELMIGKTISDASGGQLVAVTKYAINGTNLYGNWNPHTNGSYYSSMRARVNDALAKLPQQLPGTTGKVAGFFWMQGESDAIDRRTTAQYQADLTNLIEHVRADFGDPNLPFIIGRITTPYGDGHSIRDAQAAVAANVPHTFMLDTDSYEQNPRPELGHYSTQGMVDLGIGFGNGYISSATTTVADGGIVEVGFGGAGSLTLGGLTFSGGGTVNINNIGNYTSGPAINVLGSNGLNPSSTAGAVTIALSGTAPSESGTAHILQYVGTLGGAGFNAFALNASAVSAPRVQFSLSNAVAGYVDVNYSVDRLVWSGGDGGNWITSGSITATGTTNWTSALSPSTFTNFVTGDAPVFSDSASGTTTVSINTANVSPASVAFTNITKAYTLQGAFGITGSASLTKSGSGLLTITNSNSYTGTTTINGGMLSAVSLADGGTNSSIGASPSAAGNLVINGGSLQYTGGSASSNRLFTINSGGATLDASGTGPLVLSNSGALAGSGLLTLSGTNTGSNALSAAISSTSSVTKAGPGTWVLSGSNTYSGTTTISGGVLQAGSATALGNNSGNITFGGGALQYTAASAGQDWSGRFKGSTTAPITLDTNSQSVTFASPIDNSNTAGLTKQGAGTLTLTNSQAYSGPTIITGGTLKLGTFSGVGSQSFNASGTWTDPAGLTSVNYLVVGGGGGGGSSTGGGGGGGQVLQGTLSVTPGTSYPVTVGGAGAANGGNGGSSVFGSVTALGGGGGGTQGTTGNGGATVGSAGGAGGWRTGTANVDTMITGATQTDNLKGYSGGNGHTNNNDKFLGGGGGGAGGLGGEASLSTNTAGNGGIGVSSSITGALAWYGAGGGGAAFNNTSIKGTGGSGVGGNGAQPGLNATVGSANTGSGGGGGGSGTSAAAGGTGIVVLSWGYSSTGTLPSATALSIAAGSTLDLNGTAQTIASLSVAGTGVGGLGAVINSSASTPATLTLTSGITLSANSSMAGTGAGNLTIALGSGQPITLINYDGSTPALSISQGTLSLNNNPFTINGSSVLDDGVYNIVTAASNITDGSTTYPIPTGTALTGKTAYITVSGGNVVLHVSGGAVTTVHHFEVTGIAATQTAGTAITGVTITAQDASNNTATDFTGVVTFGGTAGITGTSAAFTAGQLTGVSVTPITAGSAKTFIVTGYTKTGSATFGVNPGAVSAANSTATASPATGVSTDGTTSTITVTAKDANNNLIAGATVSASSSGTNNTLSTPADTNVSGQTTFTIASTKAETKTLTVTIAVTPITAQPSVTFVAGTALAIALTSGDNQIGTVATPLASPFVVTVTDANGNPKSGTSVAFAVTGSPSGATGQTIPNATTGANGQGTSTLTLGSATGSYTVTATATGLTGSPVTFTATAWPAAAVAKAATGTDLIAGASWTGGVAPVSTNVAYWISSSLGSGLTLATSSSWKGINVAGALSDIGITGAGTLTLGSSGIDMSGAGVNLSMDNPITLNADQTWTVTAARTLTMAGNLSSATTGAKTLTVNGAGNTQIGGNISNGSGTLALTKSGTGTLTLSGTSNTYTVLTTVSGGTLAVSGGSGRLGTGAALTMSGGALDLGTTSQTVGAISITAPAASGDTLKNGDLTGASYAASNTTGNAIVSASLAGNSATLGMSGTGGTLTLSNQNTFGGTTTLSAGTLVVAHQNALQNSTLTYSAGTLQLGNSANNVTAVTLGGLSGSSNIALTNAYSTPASVALTVGNNSASTSYDGVLSDGTVAGGSLIKTGTGTLTLSKAQTYTGPTTITGGTLKIGVTSAVGSQIFNATPGGGTWTAPTGVTSVNYLVVGGGGGGGGPTGGGGGGGQVRQGTLSVTPGNSYPVTVGGGGGAGGVGVKGVSSVFSSITAYGGGGGNTQNLVPPGASSTLGSGGGGGCYGTNTTGQPAYSSTNGYGGGTGGTNNTYFNGGGGGGMGGVGGNSVNAVGGHGGYGGIGALSSITGSSVYYGGGGGGGIYGNTGNTNETIGTGGSGGGGNGCTFTAAATVGSANTGGGGGGGGTGGAGAAGGSGIVVLSWNTSSTATLPSTTALSIADGSTLDLNGAAQTVASLSVAGTSAVINSSATAATLTLTSGITLSANSTMAGTGSNLTIALGSGQPISLTYDGSTPALSISQGTLSLNNNPFTINGSVLANGEYYIVTATAITDGSTTYPTPTGTAITGKTASITVSGVNVVLTVSGGGDVTQPEWVSGWPKADTATSNGFTVRAKANEAGNAYYVVVAAGASAPTAAQVKAGYDSTGSSALRSGTLALTVDTENSDLVTGLSPGTSYDVWFVAEDGVSNLQADPSKVIVTVNPGAVSAANSTATASPATGVSTDGGATSTITVTAKDEYNNVIAGATVSASSSGTNNTLSTPANTNGSGQTTFTIASTKAETKTLTVTIAGTSITAQPSVEFVAGTAATIALTSGNNQNATVGTALASPCVVTVTDANGNPKSGTGVTFAVATTPSDATGQSLSTTSATTDGSGQAWSTLTLGTKSGNYTVTATAGSLTGSPVTFTVTGDSAAANKVRVESAADGTGTVVATRDVTAGSPHTVYAITRDTYDNFVANPSATWSLEGISDGVVGGDLVAGGASAEFTGHMVGSANIQAVVSSFTGQSGLQTVTPAAANKLVFTTNPDGATVGSAFGTQPVVKTQDTYGNLSSVGLGSSLPVILAVKTGTGTLLGTTPYDIGTSAGNGTITGSGLHIDQAGDFTLSATADGLTEGDSASFTVQSMYQAWLATNGNATASDANFLTFAFGASVPGGASGSAGYAAGPPVVVTPGQPTTTLTSGNPVVCRAVFSRRSDYVTAGLSYTLQFSADLNFGDGFREDVPVTTANGDTIKLLGTGIVNGVSVEVMSVSYPLQIMVGGVPKKPTFYRVKVNTTGS